jgi:uncharacterized cupin superfamily protein
MTNEARIEPTDHGLAPRGDGWYVLNARQARWFESERFGRACTFEGEVRFPRYGVNVHVLERGQPNCMYHAEDEQEDFLVLAGECLLIVEGQERLLRQWDFVHCPSWTEHVFVGASDEPCVVLMIGTRTGGGVRYPVNEAALRHGAGVETETDSPAKAYAPFDRPQEAPYREGDL